MTQPKTPVVPATLAATLLLLGGCASTNYFSDTLHDPKVTGWKIVREQPDAWRSTPEGLELRVLPGNLWGGANDAQNVFVHPVPDPEQGPIEVKVTIENRPTEQYEQVNLSWYYNDSYQVKLGQELVDGKLCVVMGREEKDQARTVNILPLNSPVVSVRFIVEGNRIGGSFRTPDMADWQEAGACALPAFGVPKISLQAYQGPDHTEHWARISGFSIEQRRR